MPDQQLARRISRRQVIGALGFLFVLNLLLRVFYLRYQFLNGDETIRALTAVRFLEGGTIYVDTLTDKPPGAALFYALIFEVFGRSMSAVHLAAWIWNFLTAVVIYAVGGRLASRRVGIIAAALFVYFSSNYLTQDMMAANTEMLMALPYSISFLLFVMAQQEWAGVAPEELQLDAARRYWVSFGAGVMAGLAVIFKQVGVFVLLFFAAYAAITSYQATKARREGAASWILDTYRRLAPAGVGFGFAAGSLLLWLYYTGALGGFWRNSVQMGAAYVASLPPGLWLRFMVTRLGAYVLFNGALWALAAWAATDWWKRRRSTDRRPTSTPACAQSALVLWAGTSLLGVFAGGRFFGHYFFTLLPALSLLGAIGLDSLLIRLRQPDPARLTRLAAAGLAMLFVIGFVRFHHRTGILAYEAISGTRTHFSESWGMTHREREATQVAAFVRERIGEGEPLYIWGFSLDVYWWSGCRPASRFLTPNYVAGHFYPELSSSSSAQQPFWRKAREQLIEDLRRSRPRLILNTDEALYDLPFPEITEFIRQNYAYEGQIGSDPSRPFLVFRLKEKDKSLKRAVDAESTR
jgi:4-amino-4-deoxy-L-arabinose transferase-like glycosyltransferase